MLHMLPHGEYIIYARDSEMNALPAVVPITRTRDKNCHRIIRHRRHVCSAAALNNTDSIDQRSQYREKHAETGRPKEEGKGEWH